MSTLRICLVTETLATGVGRHVVDLARGLAGGGHAVHVLHSANRCDPGLATALDHVPNVRRHAFAMRRAPHPSDGVTLYRLLRYLRAHGPFDVIHGHSSKGGAFARILGRPLGAAVVYTPHAFVTLDPQLSRPERLVYGAAERALAGLTDRIVCCSPFEQDHAHHLGISGRRTIVVEHGIDRFAMLDRDSARRAVGAAPEAFVVGFVGRLSRQKGPDILVRAASLFDLTVPPVQFVAVGDGPMGPALREQVRKAGLERQFLWAGPRDARELLPAFDLLAMPSRYEGFSYTLIEALLAGVPVVSTRVGAAASLIRPGENGFLMDPEDAAGLAAIVRQFASRPDEVRALARRAAGIGKLYGIDRMIERTLGVYYAACRRSGGSGWKAAFNRRLTIR